MSHFNYCGKNHKYLTKMCYMNNIILGLRKHKTRILQFSSHLYFEVDEFYSQNLSDLILHQDDII